MADKQRILIVDDTPSNIRVLHDLLKDKYRISIATNGFDALELARASNRPDLILLDIMMPGMDGYEVCRQLKRSKKTREIPILFVTAKTEVEDEKKGLDLGAVDYITKPISLPIAFARIRNHMSLHLHQEHLEEMVGQRTRKIRQGYIETVDRLTLAAEYKDEDTGAHIRRIGYYTRELAGRLGLDSEFCDSIFHASPMHDIGKVAIPDAVLLKRGPLNADEWEIMKIHAEIGAKILAGSESPFLRMAFDIAGCHHERWDGKGYPGGLQGEEIPLTARIMNITDQYDALRSKRPYKPALDQHKTVAIITEGDGRTMPAHFDPEILAAFKKAVGTFADIFATHQD
ncbi:MAG: response regulator [Deltaproteobacteria bacterium]|nr:response regulator [Deltaproteobacteria bacterium]